MTQSARFCALAAVVLRPPTTATTPLSGSASFSPNIANTGMFLALAAARAVSIAVTG